jgi:hypothetical protein
LCKASCLISVRDDQVTVQVIRPRAQRRPGSVSDYDLGQFDAGYRNQKDGFRLAAAISIQADRNARKIDRRGNKVDADRILIIWRKHLVLNGGRVLPMSRAIDLAHKTWRIDAPCILNAEGLFDHRQPLPRAFFDGLGCQLTDTSRWISGGDIMQAFEGFVISNVTQRFYSGLARLCPKKIDEHTRRWKVGLAHAADQDIPVVLVDWQYLVLRKHLTDELGEKVPTLRKNIYCVVQSTRPLAQSQRLNHRVEEGVGIVGCEQLIDDRRTRGVSLPSRRSLKPCDLMFKSHHG